MRAGAERPGTILDVWEAVGAYNRGLIDARASSTRSSARACPGPGTCAGNFTANTMGLACEFLGIAPLGAGMVARRRPRASAAAPPPSCGALATRLTTSARAFLDRRALRNAMAGHRRHRRLDQRPAAPARHRPRGGGRARARRAGRDQRPHAGDRQPHALAAATWRPTCTTIGGVPVVIAELIRAGLVDGDAPTVDGRHARRGHARARRTPDGDGRAHGGRAVQAARRAGGAARQPRPRGRRGQGVGRRDAPPRGAGARLRVRGGVQRGDRERRGRARRRARDPQRGARRAARACARC